MASSLTPVLRLGALTAEVTATAGRLGVRLPEGFRPPPAFTVVLLGTSRADRHRLLRGIVGAGMDEVRALAGRVDPTVPVEYAYGPRLRLLRRVAGATGEPGPWLPGRLWDRRDLEQDTIRGVRVELPAPLLADWGVRLVEVPAVQGSTDLDGAAYQPLRGAGVGILYVSATRGDSDVDVQVRERLRHRALVVVEALREEELTPQRTRLKIVSQPAATVPFVVPLVAARITGSPDGPEAAALELCLAALRAATLPAVQLETLGRHTRVLRRTVRSMLEDRRGAAHATAAGPTPLAALGAFVLLREHCRRLRPLDVLLDDLAGHTERSLEITAGGLSVQLRADLGRLLQDYNLEARSRTGKARRGSAAPGPGLGDAYVRNRERLVGMLDNIGADPALVLTDDERADFGAVAREIADDRIEIAFLGGFSTGKSSLVNALLGVPNDDNRPTLLPTSVKRETATVNIVQHAPDRRLLGVDWVGSTTLTLVSPGTEYGQFRVHREELAAFDAWRDRGELVPGDYRFGGLDTGAGDGGAAFSAADGEAAYDVLRRAPQSPNGFLYADDEDPHPLPDGPVPGTVRIDRFATPSRAWPPSAGVDDAFTAVQDPAVALRVRDLRIGCPHPLLEHMSFVDTPGTDAPVPHHREMARGLVSEKKCPVVYCFDGSASSGGRADAENLHVLREWADDAAYRRIFFVITKWALADGTARETEEYIRRQLAANGFRPDRLYYVEVVRGENEAFHQLARDLGRFVATARQPRLTAAVDRAVALIDQVVARCERLLRQQQMSEARRAADRARLRAEAAALAHLVEELETSTTWGLPWTRTQVAARLATTGERIDLRLADLTARPVFDTIGAVLRDELASANQDMATTVDRICAAVTYRFAQRVAERITDYRVTVDRAKVADGDAIFPTAALLGTVDQLIWHGFWQRIRSGRRKAHDVEDNRGLLESAWQDSYRTGRATVDRHVDRTAARLHREAERIAAGLAAEFAALRPERPPHDPAELRRSRDRGASWRRDLRNLRDVLEATR